MAAVQLNAFGTSWRTQISNTRITELLMKTGPSKTYHTLWQGSNP
ncbi:Protein of unknown function [Gryllus bimaculatus]|nr:Protein of unknown function [Gryllus bimaculatus]